MKYLVKKNYFIDVIYDTKRSLSTNYPYSVNEKHLFSDTMENGMPHKTLSLGLNDKAFLEKKFYI